MLEVLLVPLSGLLITALVLAIFFYINLLRIRRGYDDIELPPHIYTEADVTPISVRYKKVCSDVKALRREGFAAREYLNRMKKVAMLVDPKARQIDDEKEVFESACTVIKKLCEDKREGEIRSRCEQMVKDRFWKTQIKILEMLPREVFFSCGRLFLPPSPVHRVSILVKHLKMLRGVHEKQIRKGKYVIVKRRLLKPSQLRYLVKERKAKVPQSFSEAKLRLRSLAGATSSACAAPLSSGLEDLI